QLKGCGMEVDGRDAELAEALRCQLDASANSLTEALDGASTSDFIRAFFTVAMPFVDMLKDLLRFFERARAKHGPQQWRIVFDDYCADLEHFREWIRSFDQTTAA